MKRPIAVLILAGLSLGPSPHLRAQEGSTAPAELTRLMADFVQGWRTADAELLARVFALDEGRITWVDGDAPDERVRSMTFRDAVERDRAHPDYGRTGWRIVSMDIVGDEMAFVKIEIEDGDALSVDYMICYRVNGQWKIVGNEFVVRR